MSADDPIADEVLVEARDDVVETFDGEYPIVIQGLRNSFGDAVVHQDLDLKVRRGEILGVVGGSGTGKSVLMRSIIGGAFIADLTLDIPFLTFLSRIQEVVPIYDVWVGLIKAPVFGLIVAMAGCYQGMQVLGNSEEVGLRTTKAVVQAIFMVIVLDAFFAVFFTQVGWD